MYVYIMFICDLVFGCGILLCDGEMEIGMYIEDRCGKIYYILEGGLVWFMVV